MNKQTIKKSALVLGAAVLIAGAATLSVRHYQNYQKQETQKRQVIVDKQAKELAELKASKVYLIDQYNAQRVGCEKGKASYDLLSTVVKAKTAQPVCGPVITK